MTNPDLTPDDIVSTVPTAMGTEFGGVPGLIQPIPHEMTPAERRTYMVHVPADETDEAGNTVSTWPVPESEKVAQ